MTSGVRGEVEWNRVTKWSEETGGGKEQVMSGVRERVEV